MATFSEDAQMRVGKQLQKVKQFKTIGKRQPKKKSQLILSLIGFLGRGS
jgi:hypothetical protein